MLLKKLVFYICIVPVLVQTVFADSQVICTLKSPDSLNVISVSMAGDGEMFYRVERRGRMVLDNSPLGLKCDDQDFGRGFTLQKIGEEKSHSEQYQLLVGNKLDIDSKLVERELTLKNKKGATLYIDLTASNQGVGFRYRFNETKGNTKQVVLEELTGFKVPLSATAWLQPYHAAGNYTPAYEDFYFQVAPGSLPPVSREKPRGWSLPGLFKVPSAQSWMLIAESGTDGSYCACHLDVDQSQKGMYQIAFAFEDEVTDGKTFNSKALPASVLTNSTPWRVIIVGDEAKDIMNSTLVTDLAAPSQIKDVSWIKTGRASWSWWSHPENEDTKELYNSFTDLASEFGWEYTLFDAGWWNTDLGEISSYANAQGVTPLIWTHASEFYDADNRRRKLDEFVSKGIKGIKVDFWCSDRQETMAAIHDALKDAAERKLVVSLHGCTIPRGWHRTWPNLLTAEAVLGTECYFYEKRYPNKVAELNTILPFTRNVLAPMDITPFALTIRKYPRKTPATHELASSIVFNTGIIHFADSVEVFKGLPKEVKDILIDAPAAWDETVCLIGDPGRMVVVARRSGEKWFVAGLNGTNESMPVSLNLNQLGKFQECIEVTEGENPLTSFSIKRTSGLSKWHHKVPGFGAFVLSLKVAE